MGWLTDLFGAVKIQMPFGPAPCADDAHHHARVQPLMPVPGIPGLETKVGMANDYVEREFQALIAARYKMKDLARRSAEDWKNLSEPVLQGCTQTHGALTKLAEQSQQCDDAQHTDLSNLFEKRDKLPESKRQKLKGCAVFKNKAKLEEAEDCKCAAGDEHDGCRDARITSDHTLLCTQLRKRILPEMGLWKMTSPGGACHVDGKTPFNQEMLPQGQPLDFQMPDSREDSMPLVLALLPPPKRRPAAEQRTHRERAASAFL